MVGQSAETPYSKATVLAAEDVKVRQVFLGYYYGNVVNSLLQCRFGMLYHAISLSFLTTSV